MPRNITVTFADGSRHVYQGAPDDVTPDQVEARAAKEFGKKVTALDGGRQAAAPKDEPGMLTSAAAGIGKGVGQVALNAQKLVGKGIEKIGGGSAPSITDLVAPGSGGNVVQKAGRWLVSDADSGLKKIEGELAPYKEANPISAGAGEFGGQVLATLPVGGVIAKGLSKIPGVAAALPNLLTSIRTAGMSAGTASGIANPIVRALGGGVVGGASAGLVDPEHAEAGALIGAVAPGAIKLAGKAGGALSDAATGYAQKLMQSAVKPTIAQLRDGSAQVAVQTLLDHGISPTKAGVNKLRALIDEKNTQIASEIANSSATIDKANVLNALGQVRGKFVSQVSPTGDLNAIQQVADDFTAHPSFPGASIPVQAAQEMKQGTYRVLSGKYGEAGSAATEAQKGLARGLKEEIASAVPAVGPLNAEESRLLATLSVTERRALMDANKNPGGMAWLTTDPFKWAAFMADRSAAFKALAARMVNASAPAGRAAGQRAIGLAQNPLIRSSGVLAAAEASP